MSTITTRSLNSPSNLHRRKLCAGSARMEASVPAGDDENEYSAEGTLLHRHYADKGLDRSGLTAKQREVLEIADRSQAETIRRVEEAAGIPEGAPFREGYETSLRFIVDGKTLNTLMMGTCDYWRLYIGWGILLIEDLKTGFLEVADAEDNVQTAAYAAMIADRERFQRVYVSINRPRAPREQRVTLAAYDADTIPAVREEVIRIIASTKDPAAPLHPSEDACRYCRAKQVCPAFRQSLAVLTPSAKDTLLALPARDFAKVGLAIKLASQIKDAWTKEALRRIEAGELPGWTLKDNGSTSHVEDLMAAYQRFAERFGPKYEDESRLPMDFLSCTKLVMGSLEALVAKLEGVSLSSAKGIIRSLYEDLIVKEQKAKSPVMPKGE